MLKSEAKEMFSLRLRKCRSLRLKEKNVSCAKDMLKSEAKEMLSLRLRKC